MTGKATQSGPMNRLLRLGRYILTDEIEYDSDEDNVPNRCLWNELEIIERQWHERNKFEDNDMHVPRFRDDFKSFWKYSRDFGFSWEGLYQLFRYMFHAHSVPWHNAQGRKYTEHDAIMVDSIEATKMNKFVVPESLVFGDGAFEIKRCGFKTSDYLGQILGTVHVYSPIFNRTFKQFWSANLIRDIGKKDDDGRERWGVMNNIHVGFSDREGGYPYCWSWTHYIPHRHIPGKKLLQRDYGVADEYGHAAMDKYGGNTAEVWRFVGQYYKRLEEQVREWIENDGLIGDLFEPEMDGTNFDAILNLSTERDAALMEELAGSVGERKIVPPKFLYIGEGAKHFIDISNSQRYSVCENERSLLSENASEILGHYMNCPINIIDIGPGDGTKAKILRESEPGREMTYSMVDICPTMIYKSAMEGAGRWKETKGILTSFEDMELPTDPYGANLYLVLGNTLSNFESYEQVRLLENIAGTMNEQDCLLVGFELMGYREEAMDVYDNDASREFTFNPLRLLGFDYNDFDFSVGFNSEEGRVEMYFTPKRDVEAEYNSSPIILRRGEKVTTAISYLAGNSDFSDQLAGVGLTEAAKYEKDGYAMVLAKKETSLA